MKIQTNEKHIIAAMLVSFLVGWYCASHQFSWEDWWLLGMSLSLWMFTASTTMRPTSTFRIWYSHIGLRI